MKSIKNNILIENTNVNYTLKLSKHIKKEREYKSNKFERRLIKEFTTEKIDKIIRPHLKPIFNNLGKYLFIVNKNHYEHAKISILISVESDNYNKDQYYITVITALHRDTSCMLFLKIEQSNRIYTTITYEELLGLKANPNKAIAPTKVQKTKKVVLKPNKNGLKIIKKLDKKDKYFKHKNITKLKSNNATQKKLLSILKTT